MVEIWGSHIGDYEDCFLLGCETFQAGLNIRTFQRKQPPSSR